MPREAANSESELRDARLRVPQSVVFRSFPAETVVLNLETGKYHGLNPTAGRMLEALSQSDSLAAAAPLLAAEYERDVGEVEADLCGLCRALLERGLIETDADDEL
jgi:hypothetical protein